MKLQNLTVIFIIIIIPVVLLVSLYISTGVKTIKYQSLYDTGLLTATHDAISAFEINTTNDDAYSGNPETKRNILKSSVKMFEKSLANTCGISSYNVSEIEEYIPAIVFGMYDGFYMYAPSLNPKTGKYEHSLKNYVYYSEKLDNNGTVIIYSLDNYVTVSGNFGDGYEKREGYLIDLNNSTEDGKKYKGISIDNNDDAINYYKEAWKFTQWFNGKFSSYSYLNISGENDPEDENSAFVQHKRTVIKNKIEGVLNSTITAYSERTLRNVYKMPKLLEEDWQKIYSNISMIAFFQGKNIGFTKYNGYCVLNSTNHNEYVNPNLMYFIDNNNEYHDIRCEKCKDATNLTGYKIGDFQKIKLNQLLEESGVPKTNTEGKILYDDGSEVGTTSAYKYKHYELACYDCVNGSLSTYTTVYDYVTKAERDGGATDEIKTAYFTSLARERYNTVKLLKTEENGNTSNNKIVMWEQPDPSQKDINGLNASDNIIMTLQIGDYINYRGETNTWRLIGVEDESLIIARDKNNEKIRIRGDEDNPELLLNMQCDSYLNTSIAISVRSIKKGDIENLKLYYNNFFNDSTEEYWINECIMGDVWNVMYGKDLNIKGYRSGGNYYVRPVVKLKKQINLEKQNDSSYNIKTTE